MHNRKHRRRNVLVGVLTAALLLANAPLIAQQDPSPEKIDSIFAEWDRPGSPGCAVGVIRNGRLIYQKGYGYANLDWDIPMTPTTVLYIGSVSKQFTAAAIALLAREGKLSLDDDIRKYLPEMPEYERPITVRHLVHHTSGVRDLYALMDLAGLRIEDVFPDEEALKLIASQTTLNFSPGDEYLYSNGGYFLLMTIVERASGQSFREYTQAKIFEPLGMSDTHFHDRPTHIVPRRAMSYRPDRQDGFIQSYLGNFDKVGAGGLYSTVEDLLLWDQNFYDNKVGGPGFTDFMLQRGVLTNGDTLDYAFAINDMNYNGLRIIDHGGSFMGFKADLLRFPEQRFSVATLCNLGTINPSELTRRVANLYLSDHFREVLTEYVGQYSNDDFGIAYEIVFRDGSLVLERPQAEDERLVSVGDDKFRAYGNWTVEFERDARNWVQGFTIDLGRARAVRFSKVTKTTEAT